MNPYRTCHDCGRNLRPVGTSAEDHPGTVHNQGRGLCSTDWQKRKAAGTLHEAEPVRQDMATHCVGPCGRPLRSRHKPISKYPDTVAHKAKSMCATCYKDTNGDVPEYTEDENRRIQRMIREQLDFHRALRKRRGLDTTAPIDLHEIAMAA